MREILFRGKRVDNGEWIFGSIVHQTDYYGDKCDRWFILEGDFTNDYDIDRPIEIQKETVGQYTGLKDKNGKRIFEHDIVRIAVGGIYANHVVSYDKENARFVVGDIDFTMVRIFSPKIEVIGNVHDGGAYD